MDFCIEYFQKIIVYHYEVKILSGPKLNNEGEHFEEAYIKY